MFKPGNNEREREREIGFYFILQPKAGLTYRIQIQCNNQCYTNRRPHY